MKRLGVLIFAISSLFSINVFGQNEANNWYFGNGAGISFSSGKATALTNGNLYTNEGCASISNNSGKLLFYTDGITVWDREHTPMANGSGLNGGASSTQSALIVPEPGNSSVYYIFTVGEDAGYLGLSYTKVDMGNKDTGGSDQFKNNKHFLAPDLKINMGKGRITLKNERLLSQATEKLTAVKQKNGVDYWVISHKWNSNEYYVYPLTSHGVGKPVVTRVGLFHGKTTGNKNSESIGYLKSSSDGKKLASAICYRMSNGIEVFDFDNETGTLSNAFKIPAEGYAYGLSFSPDNSKLYVSFLKGENGIVQYNIEDLKSKTEEELASSGISIISNSEDYSFGALQLGPDGKIYVARVGSYLDIINNPNSPGTACGYSADAINLGNRYSTYGLPNIVTSSYDISIGNDTSVCNGPLELRAPTYSDATYMWSTGETTSNIKVMESGTYRVQIYNALTQRLEIGTIAVSIVPPITVDLGPDVSNCDRSMVLYSGVKGGKYLWSTGETAAEITVDKSGKYSVRVDKNGCVDEDDINLVLAGKTTVFTPLRDSVAHKGFNNTTFYYSETDVVNYHLQIFSKGGKLKYESNDVKQDWTATTPKGKEIKKGEYKWVVTYNSKCADNEEIRKEGILTLMEAKSGMTH